MRATIYCAAASVSLSLALAASIWVQGRGKEPQTGESMYRQSCAACHDGGVERAPQRQALKAMSPEHVLAAMETGPMLYMAARWPAAGRRAIAEFVTEKKLGTVALATALSPAAM